MATKKKLKDYSKWKREQLSVDDILLDPLNIRLELENPTQIEIARDIYHNENVIEIVESILSIGWRPDELISVVKEEGKYYAIEGNRRLCAVKAMLNRFEEDFLPYQKRHELSDIDISDLSNLEVIVIPSRIEAAPYLESKHVKPSVRPWKPIRKAFFYYAQIGENNSAADVVKKYPGKDVKSSITMYEFYNLARSLQDIPDDVKRRVANRSQFSISTLKRLYDDRYFREKFGIRIDGVTGEVTAPINDEKFLKAFGEVICHIALKEEDFDSRGLNDEDDRKNAVDKIVNKPIKSSSVKPANTAVPVPIPPKSPVKKKVFSNGLDCTISGYPSIQYRIDELRRFNIDKFPYAITALVRNVVEMSVYAMLDADGKDPKPCNLAPNLEMIIKDHAYRKLKKSASEFLNNNTLLEETKHQATIHIDEIMALNICDKAEVFLKQVYLYSEKKQRLAKTKNDK